MTNTEVLSADKTESHINENLSYQESKEESELIEIINETTQTEEEILDDEEVIQKVELQNSTVPSTER